MLVQVLFHTDLGLYPLSEVSVIGSTNLIHEGSTLPTFTSNGFTFGFRALTDNLRRNMCPLKFHVVEIKNAMSHVNWSPEWL